MASSACPTLGYRFGPCTVKLRQPSAKEKNERSKGLKICSIEKHLFSTMTNSTKMYTSVMCN